MRKKKKIKKIVFIIPISIILLIILFIILSKNNYNILKLGNNINNQSAEKIKEYILNMQSFEAEVNITINSNKNANTYIVKQWYYGENNYKQEFINPITINGLTMNFDGTNMKLENTNKNLSEIYENYKNIGSNNLWLSSFIQDFKANKNEMYEENGKIVLSVKISTDNAYISRKKLIIDKSTRKPISLEIEDTTQNDKIYILYNSIEINSLRE